MFFPLSKLLGVFANPSDFIVAIGVVGLALLVTRWARVGASLVVSCFAMLVVLGLVSGGYGIRVWQSWEATTTQEWCVWNQLQANGHTYCDLTSFKQSHK